MKAILNSLVAIAFVAQSAVAAESVSPRMVDLQVSEVGQVGSVLKRNQIFPIETFLVGIPTQISTGSVCVEFAGQENSSRGQVEVLKVKGTTDPLIDACIQIYPMPVERVLTVDVQVNNELAGAEKLTSKTVEINGTLYRVTLDPKSEKVSISPMPVIRRPRPVRG